MNNDGVAVETGFAAVIPALAAVMLGLAAAIPKHAIVISRLAVAIPRLAVVIPAKAGIHCSPNPQLLRGHWIPAFAGMTNCATGMPSSFAGMTN